MSTHKFSLTNLTKYLLPGILVSLLVIALFSKLIFGDGVVTYGDNPYLWPDSWRAEHLGVWDDNLLGQISPSLSLNLFLPEALQLAFSATGLSVDLVSKVWVIGQAYLFLLVVFFVARAISKSNMYGYLATAFVALSHFMIEQYIYWSGPYFLNATGGILLLYLIYLCHTYGWTRRRSLCIVLASILVWHPFYLAMFVGYFGLFALFELCVSTSSRKYVLVSSILVIVGILLLRAYWILPFVKYVIGQGGGIFNGNLVDVYNGFVEAAKPVHIFLFGQYPRALAVNLYTSVYDYYLQFALVASGLLFSLVTLIRRWEDRQPRNLLMFFLLTYLGFFVVALGPNAPIVGKGFSYVFNNFGVASFFRSFTRFNFLSLVSLIGAIGVAVSMTKSLTKKNILTFALVLVLVSHRGFFSGDLSGVLPLARVPNEYLLLNKVYFKHDFQKYNIMIYPNTGYEATYWNVNRNTKAFTEHTYFRTNFFSKPVITNMFAVRLEEKFPEYTQALEYYHQFRPYVGLHNDLVDMNVSYVIVAKDVVDILDPRNIGAESRMYVVPVDKYVEYFSDHQDYILHEENQYFNLYEVFK